MKIHSCWKKEIITKQLRLFVGCEEKRQLNQVWCCVKVLQITDKTDKYISLLK